MPHVTRKPSKAKLLLFKFVEYDFLSQSNRHRREVCSDARHASGSVLPPYPMADSPKTAQISKYRSSKGAQSDVATVTVESTSAQVAAARAAILYGLDAEQAAAFEKCWEAKDAVDSAIARAIHQTTAELEAMATGTADSHAQAAASAARTIARAETKAKEIYGPDEQDAQEFCALIELWAAEDAFDHVIARAIQKTTEEWEAIPGSAAAKESEKSLKACGKFSI